MQENRKKILEKKTERGKKILEKKREGEKDKKIYFSKEVATALLLLS